MRTLKNVEHIGGPELSFEISECELPLEEIIKHLEEEFPNWKFDRTEHRYMSCIMAIFQPRH